MRNQVQLNSFNKTPNYYNIIVTDEQSNIMNNSLLITYY